MPYIIVSSAVTNVSGIVPPDSDTDGLKAKNRIYIQTLDKALAAELVAAHTDEATVFKLKGPVIWVLDKLETMGYKTVGTSAGAGYGPQNKADTLIWTLYKPAPGCDPQQFSLGGIRKQQSFHKS